MTKINNAVEWKTADLIKFVQSEFASLADIEKARPMAAYMKTEMPFYGIQKPERIPVYREMKKRFPPSSNKQYRESVLALWQLPHREEKYSAIEYARQHHQYVGAQSFSLYERLIREGAWWDLVDDIAVSIVSDAYLKERDAISLIIESWIADPDMWIRRAALLSHNHHKGQTNFKQLSTHILRCCEEKEFFIRKAIGWALREYSYTNPIETKKFLLANRERLSALSFREGSKRLRAEGHMD